MLTRIFGLCFLTLWFTGCLPFLDAPDTGTIIPATCADCDDKDNCTIDECAAVPDGGVTCTHTPLVCYGGEECINGECTQLTTQKSNLAPPKIKSCDDDNLCTKDFLSSGACGHAQIDCDDKNPQTTDSCNPKIGCDHFQQSCDDGNICTKDLFVDGVCKHAQSAGDCDDGNPCTQDGCCIGTACGGEVAFCVHKLRPDGIDAKCDDGQLCTTDGCNEGYCAHMTSEGTYCDDGNICTQEDQCTALGCVGALTASYACDDGDACTKGDLCSNGICQSTKVACDDNNPCTQDSCNPKSGCHYENNNAECSDGNACTTECCSAGVCKVKSVVQCNDDNVCTTDSCDPDTGTCQSAPANGVKCGEHSTCSDSCCYED